MQKFVVYVAFLVFLFPPSALAQSEEEDPSLEYAAFVPDSTASSAPTSTSASSSTATPRLVPVIQPRIIKPIIKPEPEDPSLEYATLVPDSTASSAPTSTSASSSTATPRPVPPMEPQIIKAEPEATATKAIFLNSFTGIDTSREERNIIIVSVLAALASVLFFFGIRTQKKRAEDRKDNKRCLDIKKQMEEKFDELTDMKDRLIGMAKDKTQEKATDMTSGTKAGKLMASLEEGEKAYEKLKNLYEECTMSLDRKDYQGVIITESLSNKELLNKVKILETKIGQTPEKNKAPWAVQWTQNTFEIPEQDAEKVAKQLSSELNVWYADFKNEDYHFIVYRGRIFKVDLKDPVVYKEAKQYGISLGIPEHQVDFPLEDEVIEKT